MSFEGLFARGLGTSGTDGLFARGLFSGSGESGAATAPSATRSPWPARWAVTSRPTVSRRLLAAGEVFIPGDLLRKDGSNQLEAVTGSSSTDFFATAAEPSADVIEAGFITCYELNTTDLWGMMGTRDPVAGDIDTSYGLVKDASNNWVVDFSDTTNTRVTVQDVDTFQNYAYVVFIGSHIQA